MRRTPTGDGHSMRCVDLCTVFIAVGRLLSLLNAKPCVPAVSVPGLWPLAHHRPGHVHTHTRRASSIALCTHTVVGSVRDSLYTLRAHTDHQLASPLFALSPHSLHTQERVAKIAHHKRASPTHVAHTQLSSHRRSGVLSLRALRCSLQKPLSIRTRGYQGRAYLRCTRSCTPRLTTAGVPALTHPSKCPFPTQRRPPTKRGTPHQTHTPSNRPFLHPSSPTRGDPLVVVNRIICIFGSRSRNRKNAVSLLGLVCK